MKGWMNEWLVLWKGGCMDGKKAWMMDGQMNE